MAAQTGTLDGLISLSEDLPKQESFFTATVAKTVDTLRNLLNNDPSKLSQHILVNEQTVDEYIQKQWKWNEGRYGVQRGLREIVETLNKVCCAGHRNTRSFRAAFCAGNDLHRLGYEDQA